MRFILASKSPRRRELLGELISDFEIITRDTDETLPVGMHPKDGVEILAIRKGRAVSDATDGDCIIVSSDTLVELGGVPLGKPESREDAYRMLRLLSGKWHNVHTGVAVHRGSDTFSGVATTRVKFREMSDEDIYAYIDTGEPMDKSSVLIWNNEKKPEWLDFAGSYGIQTEFGRRAIKQIDGNMDNVMGLPLDLVRRLLKEAGYKKEGCE